MPPCPMGQIDFTLMANDEDDNAYGSEEGFRELG
jgi:hypothetical protein